MGYDHPDPLRFMTSTRQALSGGTWPLNMHPTKNPTSPRIGFIGLDHLRTCSRNVTSFARRLSHLLHQPATSLWRGRVSPRPACDSRVFDGFARDIESRADSTQRLQVVQ